ncbi:MFS transporter [Nocardia macrotermitis]|uniref:Putative multidrug resistance protein MdtD n=1 Tax=Nocardia macrotermitis TaxID=2585198 RepID=A0A7K0D9P9_9NOCA|nr:MFS transporter [Nocardia macrotermitis]MQY21584.1 putative multidrug resistance protein MdtD [Nocardia macrotermitis]
MDNVVTQGDSPGSDGGWTPRLVVSLVSMMLLLEILAVSYAMVSMAIPSISAHFRTAQGAWLITAFLLVGAITGPVLGKLADVYGKRKVLLGSVAVSAVGSLISALAPSFGVLIFGRCLTGFLASAVFLSYSLIRDIFPGKTVALAVSLCTTGMGLIAIAAPFLGGWLIDSFGFRSLFWFFAVALVVFGVLILLSTPESVVRLRSRIDWAGAILLGAGIAAVLVAISFGPSWGWANGSTLAYLIGGVVLLGCWLVSAMKVAEPLIDLHVLRRRPVFLTAIASSFCYGGSALLTVLLPMVIMTPAALHLGYGFGVDAKGFALYQTPNSITVILAGMLTGMLIGRRNIRPRVLMAVGLFILAVGFALIAVQHDSKVLLMVFMGVAGIGIGLGYSSIPNILIEAVPPQLQATTSSVVNAIQSIISSVVTLLVFTVLNNSYRAPIPAEVTHGATLYTDAGYRVAFLIGTVGAVIGALAALGLPRRIERVGVPTDTSGDEDAPVLAH